MQIKQIQCPNGLLGVKPFGICTGNKTAKGLSPGSNALQESFTTDGSLGFLAVGVVELRRISQDALHFGFQVISNVDDQMGFGVEILDVVVDGLRPVGDLGSALPLRLDLG